ncbi:vps9 domain protein [Stagonosporopsis vannaccii]|nr:vps9 domain protein [Stagonosporopsis vannaccii]
MPPVLNPFLRAFFRSALPSQCSPAQHHVLLVPTTDVLLTARDKDSGSSYADLSGSEEFLASHVLRVPGGVGPNNQVRDASTFRETRGKAKQFTTANGRTVIVKDAFIYSNKGFKTLNQAQLLSDTIFYPDTFEAQPWLVYFISRPLIGTFEATPIIPATLAVRNHVKTAPAPPAGGSSAAAGSSSMPRKKEVKSFGDLLNHFPMIARQMQPGLERLFKEFGKELEKPLPPTPSTRSRRSSQSSRRRGSVSSVETAGSRPLSMHSSMSHGPNGFISTLEIGDEEDAMRNSLETAVTAAIDLFQMVDKQQLSLLGATTDLTGPIVERMIERYIAEQVHHTLLFPRICDIRRLEDLDLERQTRQMQDIDISQVGIDIGNGRKGKQELAVRLSKAVDMFKKMGVAGSPQEMLEIVLAVTKHITMPDASSVSKDPTAQATLNGQQLSEKHDHLLTINADTLVSLLLIVVIRAPVRHLQARLSYMRHFIFIDDVETGEMGYALSTFEAVLSYLQNDSGGLRKASRRNRKLWQATKTGDLATIQGILEPDRSFHEAMNDSSSDDESPERHHPVRFASFSDLNSLTGSTMNGDYEPRRRRRRSPSGSRHKNEDGPLAHIFPFQRAQTPTLSDRPKLKKTVSYDTRSMSSCSARSFRSRTTIDSRYSAIEGDTSIEKLVMTQSSDGESILMMAIESKQDKALQYLLKLTDYYTPDFVFEDCNNEGTTLLSLAVQLAHSKSTDTLLAYILENSSNPDALAAYFAKQDSKGRCMAHYLFNQPRLIQRLGHLVPWRLKDKNGQTPVFALCRSYDHEEYHSMVDQGLLAATYAQEDGQPLHLDEHVDAKGNSLLHVITDPQLANKLLYRCDSDANATNDKHFTPLMVASKYGRTDMVRVLFQDPRVDLSVRDARGLTAVELAKDDDVRNRIDDLVLLSNEPGADGRITTVVRSFFVEDGTVRLVLKSGAPNSNGTITVTTCRRSSQDFENLAKWLAQENPASWLPVIANMASPYLIPSRPSRSVLRDLQLRLDSFLKILLRHPTFSMHEMVWEFFLVPDIDSTMLAQRSARKAELRVERLREELTPIYDVREVELFVQHARENVRSLHHASKSVLRRTNKMRMSSTDLTDAAKLSNTAVHSLTFLPDTHLRAFERYTKTIASSEASPIAGFYYNMHALSSTITAVLTSLTRPSSLISSMSSTQKAIDRHDLSVRRSDRWPLGLLDDARSRVQRDAQEKMDRSKDELADLGRELRYTQQVVASELASWQESRVEMGRRALRDLGRRMVVVERARLESMRRAVRELGMEGRKKMEANGTAAQSDGAGSSVGAGSQLPQEDDIVETNGVSSLHSDDGLSQAVDDVMLPPGDGPRIEDLVEGPSDKPDQDTPLLDLAAEAPEQLDGIIASASASASTAEDNAPPDLPPRI